MTVQHILVIGETRSGKTYWANKAHQAFPRLSVFFNSNEAPVWGTIVHTPSALLEGVRRGATKFNYIPPPDQASAQQHLAAVRDLLYRYGKGAAAVWAQVVVDEAQRYTDANGREDPVEDLARRGLGAYGVRLIAITQYPTALNPGTRTNCAVRVIFRPGIEGTRFLQAYGAYPVPEIEAHTAAVPHGYARYTQASGWAYFDKDDRATTLVPRALSSV